MALANSAALHGKSSAYLLRGIDDPMHEVVGTTFVPDAKKVGNKELDNWLMQRLDYPTYFDLLVLPLPANRDDFLAFWLSGQRQHGRPRYRGTGHMETRKEEVRGKVYASGFE